VIHVLGFTVLDGNLCAGGAQAMHLQFGVRIVRALDRWASPFGRCDFQVLHPEANFGVCHHAGELIVRARLKHVPRLHAREQWIVETRGPAGDDAHRLLTELAIAWEETEDVDATLEVKA
jgi:hypothetical protein